MECYGWQIQFYRCLVGLVVDQDKDGNIISVCPARVKYRGFTHETNTKGYIKTANYMKENAEEILKEAMQ